MLSVNSNPTSTVAFKGKPYAKAIQKGYVTLDKLKLSTKNAEKVMEQVDKDYLLRIKLDPKIPKDIKSHMIRTHIETISAQLNLFNALKKFF